MRNQRTTRRRTFSVSAARSAWVIGRAGNCLRQAACPQEGRRPATGWHEDVVGRARMQVHVVIEPRSEAVQKGHGTESRTSRARPVTVTGRGRRSTEQPLYSRDEDPREGCDRAWAVSEEAAQSLRHGDHPLPHGHRGNDAVDEMRSCLCHPAAIARRADTPALAASHRQGGPSMAPSYRAADGNAKGSHGCRTRLSREATTKPCPHDVQRALKKAATSRPSGGEVHSCRPTNCPSPALRCPDHSSSESRATETASDPGEGAGRCPLTLNHSQLRIA
jgi:hypothetical protein